MKTITIAIDGFSSTGKSTLAKQLAKFLGYVYIDTGAMYRAVTLYALQNRFISEKNFDSQSLISHLQKISIEFKFNESLGFSEVYLNGINVENEIRTLLVSQYVSQIAKVPEVRQQLVKQQRLMGEGKGVVMDGRDIGSVVFPDAELKLFMTASLNIRAKRRYKELIKKNEKVSLDEVCDNIKNRDFLDSNRKNAPLLKDSDAIEIDNSSLTPKEQFDKVLAIANQIINE